MGIGRMFPLEAVGNKRQEYPASLGSDVCFCMSGRCAIYACLLDFLPSDSRRVVYAPAYTCETVLASYLKAGYSCRFYDIDPEGLRPRFREEELDEVSLLSLCGYYGVSTYDREFVRRCAERGIVIIHDTTHTPFQPDPAADYIAGSMRKWMGIACGGIAAKRKGHFSISPLPVDPEHLAGRYASLELAGKAQKGDLHASSEASSVFWETELALRKSFDAYGSDEQSRRILEYYPYDDMIARRRANYGLLLGLLGPPTGWAPVFPLLPENATPSHFSLYADDREDLRSFLAQRDVATTVYWPIPPMIGDISSYPGAEWIYNHICSIQIDQRYGAEDMRLLASCLNAYSRI
ncbi:PLP-dependent aminotransferase family protein [Sediminispirochaeta smaragdinae]|uniref:DegT/DnrJ/EryC1/StrS aminotransferase n=1 Tax=Sediminispirochaeta smaragdinae (strain DSM 11293 / JCM 15392 / SEBR 4228) TaxID=573413 RepID=E1R6R0_SEDSS|nr:hypothetical protein [Sediminispirochaeta smaragdinae]ADK79192.1 hypothetical protein Spirs_0032 [Sediminispirochaeta smaragdinae DSM 11293]